jgi:hypothetical protein
MKILAVAFSFLVSTVLAQADPLIVHEWGTFTSLQDETGRAIAGINSDEENLPDFVHDIDGGLIARPTTGRSYFGKGIVRCHPDVTMRLETPVIYFYPKENTPLHLDLQVKFHGGWLTQFYPAAEADAPGLRARNSLGEITPQTVGSLRWRNLEVGGVVVGPPTTDHVWTSPRAVSAANVRSSSGEAEKFLFYRGVGKMDAPLRVVRDSAGGCLQLFGNEAATSGEISIPRLWLVQLRADGSCAFLPVPAITINGSGASLATLPARFSEAQFSAGNLEALRAQMHDALMREGLFADEAAALLNTWEQSYFKSPGLRLFFLLPQAWTNRHLPLEISVPATVTRSMIGRIEIVTPEQRIALHQLAEAPVSFSLFQGDEKENEGRAAYRDLGRFRDALLLDEQRVRPSAGLARFLEANRIQYAASSPNE